MVLSLESFKGKKANLPVLMQVRKLLKESIILIIYNLIYAETDYPKYILLPTVELVFFRIHWQDEKSEGDAGKGVPIKMAGSRLMSKHLTTSATNTLNILSTS